MVKQDSKSKTATHPLYIDMIKAALTDLKDRKGTSKQAIVNYIKKNYTVGDTVNSIVKMTLKRNVESKKILQVSGTGASGSFKLPAEKAAPKKKTVTKKPAAKAKPKATKKVKTPVKKAKPAKKTPAAKKAPAKKVPAKKATPKKKTASPKKKAAKK